MFDHLVATNFLFVIVTHMPLTEQNKNDIHLDVSTGFDDSFGHDQETFGHKHFIHRAQWLRAAVLGMNDGLISTSSLMIGITAGTFSADSLRTTNLAGVAGLASGALSMALGEFVSVYSQRDVEQADVNRERREMEKSEAARELEKRELAKIYMEKGLSERLAKEVAEELHDRPIEEIVKIHARDELGIDVDEYAKPWTAAGASALCFSVGAALPLLSGGFIADPVWRVVSIALVATLGLLFSGVTSASLGGAPILPAVIRIVIGGWIAMAATFGIGFAFDAPAA
jgi:VIT1/CCC1 family predicted Fe2+/Mn2+ transporter